MAKYWLHKKRPDLKNTNAFKTMFKKGGQSPNRGKRFSIEHRKKLSLSHKGQTSWSKGLTKNTDSRIYAGNKHHNWKGGITDNNHYQRVLFRKQLQHLIFKRDNYQCQICNYSKDLQIDHIQSWAEFKELRFDPENCRTLCAKCHYKLTYGREMPETVKAWGHNLGRRIEK